MVLVDMLDDYFLKEMEVEAIENAKKPVLTKLPALVLRKVAKELDVQSVKNFRGTCSRLLYLLPSPYEQLTGIHIIVDHKGIRILFRTNDKTQKEITIPPDFNTWEPMLSLNWDFVFRQRKTPLKFFSIEFVQCYRSPDASSLYNNFQQILKSRPPILAEIVHFDVSSQDDVLKILPYCDPKHLKAINLVARSGEGLRRPFYMEKLYGLEQWKRAEELELWCRPPPELNSNLDSTPFAHFSHIYIWISWVLKTRGVKRRETCYKPGRKVELHQELEEQPRRWSYAWLGWLMVACSFKIVQLFFSS